MKLRHGLAYFLMVMVSCACGSSWGPADRSEKRKTTESARRIVQLDYAASLEPFVDKNGMLILPGQRLERWSGRTFVGSSAFDVVPVD